MGQTQQPAKVLVADDDECILELMQAYTAGAGWCCTTVSNVEAARKALSDDDYDLLLTDIRMSGESGVDLIQFANREDPDLAVVVVSGIDDPDEARTIMRHGIYGYIVKPFVRSQVLITLNNALIRRDLEKKMRHRKRELEVAVRHRTSELAQMVEDLTSAKSRLSGTARYHEDQSLFLQTLLDAIPSPIFYKNTDEIYLGCNQAFESFVGLDRSQIIGKETHEVIPAAYSVYHRDEDRQVFSGPGVRAREVITPHSDGSQRNVVVNKAVFHNASGEIAGLVGVMVDITDRKRKENQLLISEEKNRNIFENIGMGIAIISPSMEIIEMNGIMQKWFPAAKADGKSICFQSFIDPPRDCPCGPCPAKLTLTDGQVHESIIQHHRAGRIRDIRIVSSALKDCDGRIISAIELVKDITEERSMERELLQAQKLASIGQLAAGVAHEINNPTGFVSSNLGTLKNYQEDMKTLIEHYRNFIDGLKRSDQFAADTCFMETIAEIESMEEEKDIEFVCEDIDSLIDESREGTERIRKIVEDLKHFAHPGQDKVQDTDINKELESTLNVVYNEIKYKATVVKELGDLPMIMANPQQLNQVFVNILVNAAQAIEKMGEIRIKTKRRDETVEIEIGDTGCGISEENLGRIFDPFFTTKGVGKGTGLGMNIAYNIIRKHNGEIRVRSCVGAGTTFNITLPVSTNAARTEKKNDETASEQGAFGIAENGLQA